MNALIQLKKATPIFFVALVCFGLLPTTRALSPAPDGGYSNFTTAEGDKALFSLTSGAGNTALGWRSLFLNTTNNFNTAIGAGALLTNTADENTAVGVAALLLNTTGGENTAIGTEALVDNTIGGHNTAIGFGSLLKNGGSDNTATGFQALANNSTGNDNVAVGSGAGMSIQSGSNNVAIGQMAGTTFVTAFHSIAIGAPGAGPFADTSGTCFIGSIHGEPTSDAGSTVAVFIDQFNVLGTIPSSRRYKHDIKPMDKASEVILALKPVTFKYNSDVKGTPCYGLIAEDVTKVDPHLVVRDKNGELGTVRYEQINAMLLNEFLKAHKKIEEQEVTIAQLKKEVQATAANQQKQIEALTAGLQKVSAQLELSKTAPQTVLNNQ